MYRISSGLRLARDFAALAAAAGMVFGAGRKFEGRTRGPRVAPQGGGKYSISLVHPSVSVRLRNQLPREPTSEVSGVGPRRRPRAANVHNESPMPSKCPLLRIGPLALAFCAILSGQMANIPKVPLPSTRHAPTCLNCVRDLSGHIS